VVVAFEDRPAAAVDGELAAECAQVGTATWSGGATATVPRPGNRLGVARPCDVHAAAGAGGRGG